MKKSVVSAIVIAVILCGRAPEAHAVIDWGWFFLDQENLISPTDTFTFAPSETGVLNARMFNGFLSDEHLTSNDLFFFDVGGSFLYQYDFVFGSSNELFWQQFDGLNLAPGEGFNFTFGTITPRNATAEPGTYEVNLALIGLFDNPNLPGVENQFRVIVEPVNSAIPEPATFSLILLGFPAIGLISRRARFF